MSQKDVLRTGTLVLLRAGASDRTEVEGLQHAAYARNRELLGVEPLPLLADYADIFRSMEVWLSRNEAGALAGALILEPRQDDLLIWSIATQPGVQAKGLGAAMLAASEIRAAELGLSTMRLYTGTKLGHLVAWYTRHGYAVERIEELVDRSVTHMVKRL